MSLEKTLYRRGENKVNGLGYGCWMMARSILLSDFHAYNNRCKNCSIEEKYLTLHVELDTLCFECSASNSVALRWRRETEKSKRACLSAGWVRRRCFILFRSMLHRAFKSFLGDVYLFIPSIWNFWWIPAVVTAYRATNRFNILSHSSPFQLVMVALSTQKYDFLIVGAGLFGCMFAHLATRRGKKCLVIDKRPHLGGNLYC